MGSELGDMVGIDWTTTSWYLGMGTTTAMGLGGAMFRSGLVASQKKSVEIPGFAQKKMYRASFLPTNLGGGG